MDLSSIAAAIVPSLIQTCLSGRMKDADAYEAARRLLRIEVRTNLAILDATLPPSGTKLANKEAMAIVGHLTTVVSRACLGAIGMPNKVITRLDSKTKGLIREDRLPAQWRKGGKVHPITLADLLDYLTRKDAEMKAVAAIEQAAGTLKGTRTPRWLTRLRNFHKVTSEVARALSTS